MDTKVVNFHGDTIQVFKFEGENVRTVTDSQGNPWWVAKEVAEILGYKDAEAMTRRLDDDEKKNLQIVGLVRYSTVINESGLYSAIIGSKKDEAKKFKRWITRDVLPSIRKTGSYSLPQKDWTIARTEGKQSRRVETDVIQKFIAYAKSQGSKNAPMYYQNFSKMVNSALLDFTGKAPHQLRDQLNTIQLHTLSVAEAIVARTLVECMSSGRFYKESYQMAKEKITAYGLAVGKSRPGLTAREYIGLVA